MRYRSGADCLTCSLRATANNGEPDQLICCLKLQPHESVRAFGRKKSARAKRLFEPIAKFPELQRDRITDPQAGELTRIPSICPNDSWRQVSGGRVGKGDHGHISNYLYIR